MEVQISETPPGGIVKMWRLEDALTGELISAVTLEIRDHVYTLGDLAVREDHRNEGYGRIMQNVVFDEARKMGIKELWGSAKVPAYYYPFGWERMDWDSSPKVAVNCHGCSRRGISCFPEILRKKLWITRQEIIDLLHDDVVPALGCTEPVCVALAAADAAKTAGGTVCRILVQVNPNIYKNGMSVAIPGYSEVGLDAAAALGALLKNPEKGLELLEDITPSVAKQAKELCGKSAAKVDIVREERNIFVRAEVHTDTGIGVTVIRDAHTNIVERYLNGNQIYRKDDRSAAAGSDVLDRLKAMKIQDILALVEETDPEELSFLEDGIVMNEKIAAYGMDHEIGVGITKVLKTTVDHGMLSNDLMTRILLKMASAAEGRLGGCMLPSMSSSGAGTKGLVVILPVAELAREIGAPEEKTWKALAFAHLVNRYINLHIGRLAAVCTCVMASATAACAAMTWLLGGDAAQVGFAIRNMAGTVTGMICDGGKVGCALKVSMASSAALTNAILAANHTVLRVSDGICAETPEQCIRNMTRIGNPGMLKADEEILDIMLSK